MAGREYTTVPHNRHVNASDFFASLKGKAKDIAEEEAQKMADSMAYILRHRLTLKGGNGKWPRFDPTITKNKDGSPRQRPKSKKSFDNWKVQKRKDGEYWITNRSYADNGFNYVNLLMTGKGWPEKVRMAKNPLRIVKKGNLVFSSQMPNGLQPWLLIKRDEFEKNVVERFTEGFHA